jgi:hypothetical protein
LFVTLPELLAYLSGSNIPLTRKGPIRAQVIPSAVRKHNSRAMAVRPRYFLGIKDCQFGRNSMPLTPSDKGWIDRYTQKAIKDYLDRLPPKTADSPAHSKLIQWLKEWGVLGLVGAAVLVAIVEWNHFTNDMATFRKGTDDRLEQLEKQLPKIDSLEKELQKLELSQSLKEISSSDPVTFSRSLPDLKKILDHPVSEVKPTNPLLHQLASKLRETSDASPDYWPAVLQFIRFASSALAPVTDVPPPGTRYTEMHDVSCVGSVHCMMASHRAILLDGGSIPNSVFDHCRIKFTENPVGLSGVKFINCVFEMPITSSPTPYLKKATQILLASGLSNVEFPPT